MDRSALPRQQISSISRAHTWRSACLRLPQLMAQHKHKHKVLRDEDRVGVDEDAPVDLQCTKILSQISDCWTIYKLGVGVMWSCIFDTCLGTLENKQGLHSSTLCRCVPWAIYIRWLRAHKYEGQQAGEWHMDWGNAQPLGRKIEDTSLRMKIKSLCCDLNYFN